ncbi:MAG: ATP-binding cassette domain-containing protein [Acidobacteriia bacterium]|nr:ATP-binding cassette domain-containing protein [Terriglobia bacterium]
MSSNYTLAVENVTKRFDNFTAVDSLSLHVPEGTMYGLLGPNGAGKTTTLRMIMNITIPDSGSVAILGRPMSEELKEHIGYLPEERGLYPKMKVGETLLFFGEIKGMTSTNARSQMDLWLGRMDLLSWKEKKVNELSKGMQQKIQFIATIMNDPELIILDEPFAGLDPVNADFLKDVMLELKKRGRTIIFSTHRMEQVEKLCDNICLINKSKKILDGSLREIKRGYGKNTVIVEYDGDDSFMHDERFVQGSNNYGKYAELKLKPDASPQELLRSMVEKTTITRFEVAEPSLNEIFKEVVGQSVEELNAEDQSKRRGMFATATR